MKCWNCHEEIPDGARSCSYCETKQDRRSVPSEDAVIDAVELIDPDLLDSLKDLAMASETAEGSEPASVEASVGSASSCS